MAANRFENELRFNGTSAADFLLTLSRSAKRWLNTCIRSSPLHIPPKPRGQAGRGNWSREVLREDESQRVELEYADGWFGLLKGFFEGTWCYSCAALLRICPE